MTMTFELSGVKPMKRRLAIGALLCLMVIGTGSDALAADFDGPAFPSFALA